MGRASGKKTPRLPILDELLGATGDGRELTEGERREAGVGDTRDIPGGLNHLGQDEVVPQKVPVPDQEWPFYRSDLAHGVPPDEAGHHDRVPVDRPKGGQSGHAKLEELVPPPLPVPVYIVEEAGGQDSVRTAFPRSITCPASTAAEPARVCGLNPARARIGLLNEDTATDIRFAAELGALSAGTGALLPWPSNSYLWLDTQDELFAIGASGSGTPKLSIIEVFAGQAGR